MKKNQSEKSVSVIIPAFNEERHITNTLKAILKSDYPKHLFEIIVVDNNSTDQTAAMAHTLADKLLILSHGHVGAVRNLGAAASDADIFVFLDADCLVDSGWISRGVKLIEDDVNLACGGPYKARQDANWIERLWLLENPNHPRIQPDLLGGCIFVRSETFRSVDGFNEDMTSGEDSDFSNRLRSRGQKVKIFPELSVIHLGNPSTLSSFLSRQIWHSENYLKFLRSSVRDYTFWITLIFLTSLASTLIFLFSRDYLISGFAFLITVTLAGALSMKRVFLTKYKVNRISELIGILFLDYTYLLGRSAGIIKSFKKSITKQ